MAEEFLAQKEKNVLSDWEHNPDPQNDGAFSLNKRFVVDVSDSVNLN